MRTPPDPALLRHMQIVSGGMIAAALFVLAIANWYHRNNPGSLEIMVPVAFFIAVLAPVQVFILEKVRKPTGNAFSDHITPYGLFEGATLFCAVALMVSPSDLPLFAAVIPLSAMILRFPRAS